MSMIETFLGPTLESQAVPVDLPHQTYEQLLKIIDVVTSSKLSLLAYIQSNPNYGYDLCERYLARECTSISCVNDLLSIGLPINSLRFTLRAALHHYCSNICEHFRLHDTRLRAFQSFILDHEEVLLVFPTLSGNTVKLGEVSFTVKSTVDSTPTFICFEKRNLASPTFFYSSDVPRIQRLSEFKK